MTERQYAEWIAAYARQHTEDRRAVVDFARAAPEGSWTLPAGEGGWTRKDVLAHLAGGNDRMVQTVFLAAIEGRALAPSDLEPDTDADNARGVAERRNWSVERLIDELERDGEELLDILARLSEDHRDVRPAGASWTLGDLALLITNERHDLEHLRQIDQAASGS